MHEHCRPDAAASVIGPGEAYGDGQIQQAVDKQPEIPGDEYELPDVVERKEQGGDDVGCGPAARPYAAEEEASEEGFCLLPSDIP